VYTTERPSLEETISLLSELIQNRCVNPPGEEMRSIRTIERTLHEHGIESHVLESAPGRGNLVATIRGSGGGPRLMFGPSHVDVVPIEDPSSWEENPFSGVVKDGNVWGRGALDMLFIVAAQVRAFIELYEENFHPNGDLILLVVSDEEAGGALGAGWMVENHPELVRADYSVSEAGGISIAPRKVLFMAGEKGMARKRIIFRGKPSHGSMPFASDNPVVKLSEAVTRLSRYNPPLTTEYLSYLAEGLDLGLLQRTIITNSTLLNLSLSRLRSRDIVQGGVKVNVIPERAHVDLDIRTLPGQDEEYVIARLREALGSLADEAIIEDPEGPEQGFMSYGSSSPFRSEFVEAMERAIGKEIPGTTLIPMIMPGASDCRFMRALGAQAYGFSLFDPETPTNHLVDLAHGTNERISVKTLELTKRVHFHLAKDMLS
jgi:acetylornithine deacetylase/succinyl-diaminopimelate desuccinylase-like protein